MAMTCSKFRYSNPEHTVVTCIEHGDQIPVYPGNRHWDSIVERGCEILPYEGEAPAQITRRDLPYDAMGDMDFIPPHPDDLPPQVFDISKIEQAPVADLDALKEALRLRILAEAVRRSGMSMELFERLNEVHKTIADPNASASAVQDAENELLMHGVWSERAKVIEAAKTQKLVEVMGLETLNAAEAYDVNAGWP